MKLDEKPVKSISSLTAERVSVHFFAKTHYIIISSGGNSIDCVRNAVLHVNFLVKTCDHQLRLDYYVQDPLEMLYVHQFSARTLHCFAIASIMRGCCLSF